MKKRLTAFLLVVAMLLVMPMSVLGCPGGGGGDGPPPYEPPPGGLRQLSTCISSTVVTFRGDPGDGKPPCPYL